MAKEPTTIQVQPGSELAALLASAGAMPVLLETEGALYRLDRMPKAATLPTPEEVSRSRAGIVKAAGSGKDIDTDHPPMSQYLVDTDWMVDVLHGQEHATQTLLELASSGLAVSLTKGPTTPATLSLPWLAYGTFLQAKTSSLSPLLSWNALPS
jgi:hypothetical protein